MFKFKRKAVELNNWLINHFGDTSSSPLYIKFEDDDFIYFELAYPGLAQDDFHVSVNSSNNIMAINVHRDYKDSDCRKYWSHKKLSATFDFSGYNDVDLTNIQTEFDKAILTIKVPKVKKEKFIKQFKVR